MTFPIPDPALSRHIAVLGETGSGKTHDTKVLVEHLVGEGHRVCILDTIKSDWWGMISSSSGKRPGLPFRIIGGPRGHVPLHANAGKPIGELVAKGKLPLSIVDMADFEMGEPQQFFEEFARALWKNIRGVLYLVIEEVHELAPKERVGIGKENMAVYWAKRLATGSRTKGIRLIIASQRTQAVHNALLGSCGTMMAHSLTLPADQKPVRDWLDANILDKSLNATIKDELAFLPTGTAWVCCAKERFFEKIHFPRIATFDNTATPDKDSTDFDVATVVVDPDELRAIIGDAVKEAEANDPKLLRAEIGKLKAQIGKLSAAPAATPPVEKVDTAEIEAAAHADGYRKGRASGWDAGFRSGFMEGRAATAVAMSDGLKELADKLLEQQVPYTRDTVNVQPDPLADQAGPTRVHTLAPRKVDIKVNPAAQSVKPSVKPTAEINRGSVRDRILGALAELEAIGVSPAPRIQVAFLARYKHDGVPNFRNTASALRTDGLIDYPSSSTIALTNAGRAAAPKVSAPLTTPDLHQRIMSLLDGVHARILPHVIEAYPEAMQRDDLARLAGYAHAGVPNFRNSLSRLRSLGFVDYPNTGSVIAEQTLFLEGR